MHSALFTAFCVSGFKWLTLAGLFLALLSHIQAAPNWQLPNWHGCIDAKATWTEWYSCYFMLWHTDEFCHLLHPCSMESLCQQRGYREMHRTTEIKRYFFSPNIIVMILMIAMPCHASARVANVPLLLPFPSGHGPSVLRHQTFCRETPLGCVVSSRSIASSDVFRWHGGRLCTFLHLWSWWEIFKCILRHETPHICKKPTTYQRLVTWCATSRSFFPRRSEIGNLHHRIKQL